VARSRNIKPGICKNKKLAKLSPHARILFRDLPMFADHEGRLIDDHETVRAEIFPFEFDLDVNSLLKELADNYFIVRYEEQPLDGQDPFESRFIWIINFKRHQNPHKNERQNPSIFPPFNSESTFRVKDGTPLDKNETTRADSLNLIPDSLNPHTDSSDNVHVSDIENPNPVEKEFIDPSFLQVHEFARGVSRELALIVEDLDANNNGEKAGENWRILAQMINDGLDIETLKKAVENHTARNSAGNEDFKSRFKNSFKTIEDVISEAKRDIPDGTEPKDFFADE